MLRSFQRLNSSENKRDDIVFEVKLQDTNMMAFI